MRKLQMVFLVGGLSLGLVGCLGMVTPSDPGNGNNTGNGTGTGSGSGSGPDAGTGNNNSQTPPPSTGSPDMATGTTPPTSACIPPATPTAGGMHNAGQACLGCHNGNGAKAFTAAGTIYSGGGGASGVTIEITDSKGVKVTLVSAASPSNAVGNFYTSQALSPPLTVTASSCPDTVHMNSKPSSGDCNSCHNGSSEIHIP
jgi:hypothetical protein